MHMQAVTICGVRPSSTRMEYAWDSSPGLLDLQALTSRPSSYKRLHALAIRPAACKSSKRLHLLLMDHKQLTQLRTYMMGLAK